MQQTQISRGGPAWVRFTTQFPTVPGAGRRQPGRRAPGLAGAGLQPPGDQPAARRPDHRRRARRSVSERRGRPRAAARRRAVHRPGRGLDRVPDPDRGRRHERPACPGPGRWPAIRRHSRPRDLQAAPTARRSGQPDDWTHALMDIGSILCRPVRPLCPDCPVACDVPAMPRTAARAAGAGCLASEGHRPQPETSRRSTPLAPRPDPRPAARRTRRGLDDVPAQRSAATTTRAIGVALGPWSATACSSSTGHVAGAATGTPADRLSGYAWGVSATLPATHVTIDPRTGITLPAEDPTLLTLGLRDLVQRWAAAKDLPPMAGRGNDRRRPQAQALGVPGSRLMEQAGTAVAAAVRAVALDQGRLGPRPDPGAVRPGNNGGDGFVAARHLAHLGLDVLVVFVGSRAEAGYARMRRSTGTASPTKPTVTRIHAPYAARPGDPRPGDREGQRDRRCPARQRRPG